MAPLNRQASASVTTYKLVTALLMVVVGTKYLNIETITLGLVVPKPVNTNPD